MLSCILVYSHYDWSRDYRDISRSVDGILQVGLCQGAAHVCVSLPQCLAADVATSRPHGLAAVLPRLRTTHNTPPMFLLKRTVQRCETAGITPVGIERASVKPCTYRRVSILHCPPSISSWESPKINHYFLFYFVFLFKI